MSLIVQMFRLATAAALQYVGPVGQLVVDTNTWQIRVQDGATLGGQPSLNANNNLSDIPNPATARNNLQVPLNGTVLTVANNLDDVANVNTAVVNLGGPFLKDVNNLNDLTSVTAALANLGIAGIQIASGTTGFVTGQTLTLPLVLVNQGSYEVWYTSGEYANLGAVGVYAVCCVGTTVTITPIIAGDLTVSSTPDGAGTSQIQIINGTGGPRTIFASITKKTG